MTYWDENVWGENVWDEVNIEMKIIGIKPDHGGPRVLY